MVSAATVGGVIMILNKAYGFTPDNSDVMAAPQARAMAAVIEPLMSGQGAPWLLYGIGAVISIILTMCGVSALAFALGMFIPLQLNLPLFKSASQRKGYTPCLRLYCWRCFDGRGERRYAIWRIKLCQHCLLGCTYLTNCFARCLHRLNCLFG